MGIRYWLIQALLMLFNTALVVLAAWALGVDIFQLSSPNKCIIYIGIAFGLLLVENVIWDKIHGNA